MTPDIFEVELPFTIHAHNSKTAEFELARFKKYLDDIGNDTYNRFGIRYGRSEGQLEKVV